MNVDVSSKDVSEPYYGWYVVLDDGETGSNLHSCSAVYLSNEAADCLFGGSRLWHLEDEFPDETIKQYDLGEIFDFWKKSFRPESEDEIEKVNDLVKEASVKDQYDRYVDVELEVEEMNEVSNVTAN